MNQKVAIIKALWGLISTIIESHIKDFYPPHVQFLYLPVPTCLMITPSLNATCIKILC